MESLSSLFNQLQNLNTLWIDFLYTNIGDKGAQSISLALNELKGLNSLQLDLAVN